MPRTNDSDQKKKTVSIFVYSCFETSQTVKIIKKKKRKREIKVSVYFYELEFCSEILIPNYWK